MSEILSQHTQLGEYDQEWLKLLVSEWQLLADLSFSDLLLWVRDTDEHVFWAAAQIRPTTAPTALIEDVVGDPIAYSPEHLVTQAFLSERTTHSSANALHAGLPVSVRAIPVRRAGTVLAMVEQHTSQWGVREPSSLEECYRQTADELATMVSSGTFPFPDDLIDKTLSPRAGDGFIRLSPAGDVEFASPNALSAYRRLGLVGDLIDEHLVDLTSNLIPWPKGSFSESVRLVLTGDAPRWAEAVSGHAHLLLRSFPLWDDRHRLGAIVLCRDVSDLRSRERELMTKDATIREIHHRVKNNLQTVAALLRLQARRIDVPEAKTALADAVSRVRSIAIVHETLSQAFDEVVDFDQVVDGLLQMLGDVSSTTTEVMARRVGSFGAVTPEVATSLSMVVTELCQNALEHGLGDSPGEVRVVPTRDENQLTVEIIDSGVGLNEGFDPSTVTSLGLAIVTGLVSDMDGTFSIGGDPSGSGTRAVVQMPLG